MEKHLLPRINQEVDTVILANGEFPTHPIPLSILNNCKYLVCCDGAINKLRNVNKQPDAIVGDCDSLHEENQKKYESIIHQISEQETNDLTKAVHFCLKQGRKNIIILGATGEREDHTIGNISLLCEYKKEAEVKMVTNHGVFVAIDSPAIFESIPTQQVSIFPIDKCTLSSINLAYPINKQQFTNWWQATLNEAETPEFVILTDGRTIIYRVFL